MSHALRFALVLVVGGIAAVVVGTVWAVLRGPQVEQHVRDRMADRDHDW